MKKFLILTLWLCSAIIAFSQNNPHRSDILWVVTPNHNNWLYETNEKAEIEVALYEYGMLLDDVEISYSIGLELMEATKTGTVKTKNGKAKIDLGTLKKPGFLACNMKITRKGETYKHHIKLGFSPEKLKPYTKFPKDFEAFWKKTKEEADKCPMKVESRFVPEFSNEKIDCFLVKIQAFEKKKFVYGYLTKPKKAGKYPVVFSPPGAGVKPMNPLKDSFYAENGFIRFDMEIHGIRPDLEREIYNEISAAFGKGNGSYLVNGISDRETYYFKKVYMSCVRAIDYLSSLPEWDGKNMIVQGGSQGGALALVTAALDDRVTLCAANHPALSDMAGYKAGRAGGYPHLFSKFDGMDTPAVQKTLEYYDVVNFARQIKVPVFMTWGYNDNTCPPTTSYIVYNLIESEKEALITPVNEHWISKKTRRSIMEWIRTKLK